MKVNKPKVTMLIGKVSTISIGRIKVLSNPSTTATKSAERRFVTTTPGKRYAAIITAIVERTQCVSVFIVPLVYYTYHLA